MTRTVLYSAAAVADLDEIRDWVAGETGDDAGARAVARRVAERAGLFGGFPEMWRVLPETLGVGKGYRHLVAGAWRVFSRVEGETVRIDRILHSRRNHMQALFGAGGAGERRRMRDYLRNFAGILYRPPDHSTRSSKVFAMST